MFPISYSLLDDILPPPSSLSHMLNHISFLQKIPSLHLYPTKPPQDEFDGLTKSEDIKRKQVTEKFQVSSYNFTTSTVKSDHVTPYDVLPTFKSQLLVSRGRYTQ